VPLTLETTNFELSSPGGIGLFDSGVGGLSVLRPLQALEPRWPLVMVADQVHVPYGGRPLEEVRAFALAQTAFLFSAGVDRVVMACNISSATALDEARARFGPRRVFGMIEPGCALAAEASRRGRVGILATEGTVRSGAYIHQLHQAGSQIRSLALACPEFVPLIEAGHVEDEDARRAVEPYLAQLRAFGADVVILGCTHYPHLRPLLESLAPEMTFVDPAEGLTEALSVGVQRQPAATAPVLLTTGDPARLQAQLETMPPFSVPPRVERAQWSETASSVDDSGPRALG